MNTSRTPSLWTRFVSIAQPYFFPRSPRGGNITLALMAMLLIFVFGLLCLLIAALVLACGHLAPEMTAGVAGGLQTLVNQAIDSGSWRLIVLPLGIPALFFLFFHKPLRTRRKAWLLLAVVLLLSLAVTGINVAFSYIGNYFTNALVKKDQAAAYLLIGVYFSGFLIGIPIMAFYGYVRDYLSMRWREWMTGEFLGQYFRNRHYYEIESSGQIDNPDQRIMEDIRSFTRTSLTFLLIILGAFMDLFSFVGILWSKSVLLVCVVLGYSLLGTVVTALVGRRLVRLNFDQLRYEADFRYALVHVRDNSESIAFYQGEKEEIGRIGGRFRQVIGNFNLLIGWQRNLSFFTTAYSYLPVVLPFVILFPRYFSGEIEYGDMVQANFAFAQVYGALSLIVAQIEQITGFAAGVQRLSTFAEAIEPERPAAPGIRSEEADQFALSALCLATPNGARTLISDLNLALAKEDSLVIVGQSGVGKSSLLRAIAGLWTQGSGTIRRPPLNEIFFLPQKPYMLLGSLRDQLLYPRVERPVAEEELRAVLESVNLGDLPDRVGGFDVELDWADLLSLGEQQRLAFARLFLNRPAHAVLDEATSALDTANEASLYQQLRHKGIRYISVGHRPSILEHHTLALNLLGGERWRLLPAAAYREETMVAG